MTDGSAERLAMVGRRLVAWYRGAARDLPWRKTRDPYAVWVSETMLQQTTVVAVMERYERFLRKFPTVGDLASADEAAVLAEVQGLGYYRRFRALHRAAKIVRDDYAGSLPSSTEALEELPGVGPYMAGAILSIAFDQRTPAVDGNVVRVLSRLQMRGGDLLNGKGRRAVESEVEELMRDVSPNALTQALFDLGATICTPRDPSCLLCPIRESCRARDEGEVHRFPEPKARKAAVDVFCPHAWIERDGSLLLRRRADDEALMPGFWELPNVWASDEKSGMAAFREELSGYAAPACAVGDSLAKIRHTITHHRLDCVAFEVRCTEKSRRKPAEVVWVPLDRISDSDRPLSSISRKLIAAVGRRRNGI